VLFDLDGLKGGACFIQDYLRLKKNISFTQSIEIREPVSRAHLTNRSLVTARILSRRKEILDRLFPSAFHWSIFSAQSIETSNSLINCETWIEQSWEI
jgi:hypothetical protein